jgi:type IV secretion system protein VirB3
MLMYIMTTKFLYLVIAFPIHGIGCYICSKEPLFIELFKVRAEKWSRCKNKFFHGANSYDLF